MTIRKKILLFSALALGAFLAAVYLLSRFALLNAFARLESDSARENISHMQNGLRNEESHLEILAVDYGQWDRTYDFMGTHAAGYVNTELAPVALKGIQVNFVVLLDPSGKVTASQSNWGPSHRRSSRRPCGDGCGRTQKRRLRSTGAVTRDQGPIAGVRSLSRR